MGFPGRHGSARDKISQEFRVDRPDFTSHVRSAPEAGKAERDFLSSEIILSPRDDRGPNLVKEVQYCIVDNDAISHICQHGSRFSCSYAEKIPQAHSPHRHYGAHYARENHTSREQQTLKHSSSTSCEMTNRDNQKIWDRTVCHRSCSLTDLESPRGSTVGANEQLEGRLDRYGSASSRELASSDIVKITKEHFRYGWRARERNLFGDSSTHLSTHCRSNSNLKDVTPALSTLEHPGPTSSPCQSVSQTNLSAQINHDVDEDSLSVKKRARLTWGQGLAKYEKEKIGEGHLSCLKSQNVCDVVVESQEDMHTSSDCQSRLTENGSITSRHNHHCVHDQDSCDSGVSQTEYGIEGPSPSQDLHPCYVSFSRHSENDSKAADVFAMQSPLFSPLPYSSVLQEVQLFLSSLAKKNVNIPVKNVLTQQVEKLEQEIIQLERELNKLNDGQMQENSTIYNVSDWKIEMGVAEPIGTVASPGGDEPPCEGLIVSMVSNTENSSPSRNGKDASLNASEVFGDTVVPMNTGLMENDADRCKDVVTDSLPGMRLGRLTDDMYYRRRILESDLERSSIDQNVGIVELILLSNQCLAEQSEATLAHLGSVARTIDAESERSYSIPQQSHSWRLNTESHNRKRPYIQSKVVEEKASLRFLEKVLAAKFQILSKLKDQKQVESCGGRETERNCKSCDGQQGDDIDSTCEYSLKAHFSSGSFVSSRNEVQVNLATKPNDSSQVEQKRSFLSMPAMYLGVKERALHRFDTKNGIVYDPVAAEKERQFFNPWSKEERMLFLEKYYLFGKDFKRIAACLEHKTVADCIEFYYRNKKTNDFEEVNHRRQLEKHRFRLGKYSIQPSYFPYPTNAFISSSHYDGNPSCLEGLSLVAAAAAALSSPTKLAFHALDTRTVKPK
ncbi:hypothetical protein KP509_38G019400 [Ceratopteris richardii]|uniref:SANT domain-containing protein n=1 Tax=Ceratopteris richardii TaxID=49495 RepID=A0A8T2Q310_CERRI|nr:hypothetical protein KP509_38G019400 [Ceratopteris richardii]